MKSVRELNLELCAYFGIDPKFVTSFELTVRADEWPLLTVRQRVPPDQRREREKAFRLVAIGGTVDWEGLGRRDAAAAADVGFGTFMAEVLKPPAEPEPFDLDAACEAANRRVREFVDQRASELQRQLSRQTYRHDPNAPIARRPDPRVTLTVEVDTRQARAELNRLSNAVKNAMVDELSRKGAR